MKRKLFALLIACMFAMCIVTPALAFGQANHRTVSEAFAKPAMSARLKRQSGASKEMFTSLLSDNFDSRSKTPEYAVPTSYNEHDVALMKKFLELTDSNGVKNGQKINNFSGIAYDPDDPSTWANITWTEDGELYTVSFWSINFAEFSVHPETGMDCPVSDDMLLVGVLDLSGCQSLIDLNAPQNNLTLVRADNCPSLQVFYAGEQGDFLGASESDRTLVYASADNCPNLTYIGAPNNDLEHFSFDNAPALVEVVVDSNPRLAEIDFSDSPILEAFSSNETSITSIDLSNRSSLSIFHADNCPIESVDLSGCTSDFEFSIAFAFSLRNLDLSDCTGLNALYIDDSSISDLNLYACSNLRALSVGNSPLEKLDLTSCPLLYWCNTYACTETLREVKLTVGNHVLTVASENGPIGLSFAFFSIYDEGYDQSNDHLFVYSAASTEKDFIGWFNSEGEILSTENIFGLSPEYIALIHEADFTLTARYAASLLPGDVNGDGEVKVDDAVLIMRHALGLAILDESFFTAADVNGDGEIAVGDAVLAMRIALGLISD